MCAGGIDWFVDERTVNRERFDFASMFFCFGVVCHVLRGNVDVIETIFKRAKKDGSLVAEGTRFVVLNISTRDRWPPKPTTLLTS